MTAFNKVLAIITAQPLSGHALRNIQNRVSLQKAKDEIEKILNRGAS